MATQTAADPDLLTRAPLNLAALSIIVPAYNEASAIGQTLHELELNCPEAEIIVVDDGSTDGTGDIARRTPGVRVLSHAQNRGYGASLKTGMRCAGRPYLLWYDADGQHRPQDLFNVAAPVLSGQADAVIGVRGKGSAVQRERVPGKILLGWVARFVTRQRIPDLNSGLRCFRRDVIGRYLHLLPDQFSASTTSTLLMLKRGYRLEYAPILTRARVGTSSVKMLRDGLRTLKLILRIIVLFEAFRVFATLGLALLIPGLVYGFHVAITRGQGFPTLAGTAVLSGVLTFFMGIVADQVTELRKERFEDVPTTSLPAAAGVESETLASPDDHASISCRR